MLRVRNRSSSVAPASRTTVLSRRLRQREFMRRAPSRAAHRRFLVSRRIGEVPSEGQENSRFQSSLRAAKRFVLGSSVPPCPTCPSPYYQPLPDSRYDSWPLQGSPTHPSLPSRACVAFALRAPFVSVCCCALSRFSFCAVDVASAPVIRVPGASTLAGVRLASGSWWPGCLQRGHGLGVWRESASRLTVGHRLGLLVGFE